MERSPFRQRLCILILAATLGLMAGCGFHLRGSNPLAQELQTLTVHGPVQLARDLKRQLLASGVNVSAGMGDPAWQLLVREDGRDRRTISFDNQVESAEYEITSEISFQLLDPDGLLILGPVTLRGTRTLVHDKTRLLGNSEESNLMYQEMASESASRIMRILEELSSDDIRAAREAHAAMDAKSGS